MIEKLKYLATVIKSHRTLLKYNFAATQSQPNLGSINTNMAKANYDGIIKMMTSRNWNSKINQQNNVGQY